jgi:hypothetical protein
MSLRRYYMLIHLYLARNSTSGLSVKLKGMDFAAEKFMPLYHV